MSNYSNDQMRGSASHTHSEPTEVERAMMALTPEQREEAVERMRHGAARAVHTEKEALLQARIAAATEVSLAGNQFYQSMQRGTLKQRVSISNGQTTVEQINAKGNAGDGPFTAAPQALVDQVPVTIGGIQLGPKQAQEMMQRGEISERDYYAAVAEALVPYGYGSFK